MATNSSEYMRKYMKAWREENKDKNKEYHKLYMREWRKKKKDEKRSLLTNDDDIKCNQVNKES